MINHKQLSALILGCSLLFAMTALGSILGYSAIKHRNFERTVTVKGLSERDYPADVAIWTVEFTLASDSLPQLRADVLATTDSLRTYLLAEGIGAIDINATPPVVNDSYTNQYRSVDNDAPRYTASRSLTVYTRDVPLLINIANDFASDSSDTGVQISGSWRAWSTYQFESLNEVKPDMVEEATRNARDVAEKFAADSGSSLGRIKQARQGQFSIRDRDISNPHIKKVRVVSTIEYYLTD